MHTGIIYNLGMQIMNVSHLLAWLDVFLASYRQRRIDHIMIAIFLRLLTIGEQL